VRTRGYETRVIRRLLSAVLALLVLVEGAGVARALAASGEGVECCCGVHDAHRACKCKACPVSKLRAHAATTRLDQPRDCDGQDEPGALAVVALPLASFPSLLPVLQVSLVSAAVPLLAGRLVEAGRPPP
jgi:hypothetical protein